MSHGKSTCRGTEADHQQSVPSFQSRRWTTLKADLLDPVQPSGDANLVRLSQNCFASCSQILKLREVTNFIFVVSYQFLGKFVTQKQTTNTRILDTLFPKCVYAHQKTRTKISKADSTYPTEEQHKCPSTMTGIKNYDMFLQHYKTMRINYNNNKH